MKILETSRLLLRELDSGRDAEFVLELLNTPKFIKFIGDRGVRTLGDSAAFIENRYRQSYLDHGFGLYAVDLRDSGVSIGLCGFVKRDLLPNPDVGFAFLPDFEGQGYGFESAAAILEYGRDVLEFSSVLAITSEDNDVSGKLLEKLGFTFERITTTPEGEDLKLFKKDL